MPGLGFNSRCGREEYRGGGVVAVIDAKNPGPGPGFYDVKTPPRSPRPAAAPFLSSSNRHQASADVESIPGPGAYAPPSLLGVPRGNASDVFRSTTKRFAEPKEATPGPGAFLGQSSFVPASGPSRQPEAESRVKWVRLPTAPSIPCREQSCGYEEGQHGELIMQRPELPGHGGGGDGRGGRSSTDVPGPMHYAPNVAAVKAAAPAVDFSKGVDRLVILESNRRDTLPGPGHYNAAAAFAIGGDAAASDMFGNALASGDASGAAKRRARPTAAFRSRTGRTVPAGAAAKKPGPGPGDYEASAPKRHEDHRVSSVDNSFLCTTERFSTARQAASRIGPGSYDPRPAGSGLLKRPGERRRARPNAGSSVGFESTSLRFTEYSRSASALGPAAYEIPGLAEEVERERRRAGKNAAFGRSKPAVVGSGSGAGTTPSCDGFGGSGGGSGSDAWREGEHSFAPTPPLPAPLSGLEPASAAGAGTCVFASATQRFGAPAAGSGGGSDGNGGGGGVGGAAAATMPAPGQYYVEEDWTRFGRGVVPMGRGRTQRFQPPRAPYDDGLGPGSYSVETACGGGIGGGGRAANRRNVLVSTSARFLTPGASHGATPGPGAYDTGGATLLKPTFNICVAENAALLS
ncbi:unnamed protein product [Phaeothamnion confervicola]